jgi:hypothetical protein
MRWSFIAAAFLAFAVVADDVTPTSVANLVHQTDENALTASLTDALRSRAPLVRATAARVVAVRGVTALLPLVREALTAETETTAAREEIRALTLTGNADDIAFAAKASSQWPGMDNALAVAIARRGGTGAIETYSSTLRNTRMRNHTEFFRVAMWGHPELAAYAGSRMLGTVDEKGWRGLLGALADSDLAMNAGVIASALNAKTEDLRAASVWFLVRGYAPDPSSINDVVKSAIATPRTELSSDREDFGRELLQRMIGGEKKDNPRWLKFLESDEADDLLAGRESALQYLTDDEYRVRYNRCEVQSKINCALPEKRSSLTIPSKAVAPPAFNLPDVLPSGLANAILGDAKCKGTWLGVANASVDPAGRVKALDFEKVSTSASCKRALETVLRLSLATNTSLRSGFTGPVLLVGTSKRGLCLDEDTPENATPTYRTGGEIQAPVVLKRVEPQFPEADRSAMGSGRNVIVITESVIAKTGCVRGIRLLAQSPYGGINGAAILALSQWQFRPGYLDRKPVDVLFNLTVNFKVQ